ncbi:hypothetical protein HDV06_002498 [Boothiomyces sp. JEL0866]|nr:hypothetical protein HDV06_002498 [Boothiomyces sp. JEL0866]
MNFAKLKRRITNLKKINVLNDVQDQNEESVPLVCCSNDVPPLRNITIDHPKQTRVRFANELAITVHFNESNILYLVERVLQ